MSRSRRLSLRTRMLVLLISVTSVILLIMGTVIAVVLYHRVSTQFDAALAAEAALSPDVLASQRQYGAVEAIFPGGGRPGVTVRQVAGGAPATTALAAAVRQLRPRQIRHLASTGGVFPVDPPDGGQRLEAAAYLVPAAVRRDHRPAVFVVAQPASVLDSQVRGFVIPELITCGALIALLAIGGEWLIGRGLQPLDEMASTAHEITSSGDLAARMPDAGDQTEIGALGSAINTMLDRIQQAFGARLRSEQKVRQFAADASHELRTPLTTIRGYAELYSQGALSQDQLPNAMRRIEQEAQRMSTLVAELLELARLDRTSSLDLTETDLAAVVRDAVADAAAVEPQRPVRAEVPPRLVAVVDEPRIRQVLANLLGNVRAHTPVDTPVTVRLADTGKGVLLEVADAGPGMSSHDAARAFDRFHRGADRRQQEAGPAVPGDRDGGVAREDSGEAGERDRPGGGRPRSGGGSGLGLAIVQAIAAAHGGRATLESAPGRGTRVQIWLPVRVVG
jgi:signal transduction histidine kinase